MISVVIPLYNEEDNIPDLQEELAAALAGLEHEIVFVDDCSKDRTLERIQRGPASRILAFDKNTGQSAAMYAGIHAARGEVIVLLDGDLQNDPADIPRLLAEIDNGADLVCGYRAKRKDNLAKKITSRVANSIRSRFTNDGVRDTGCTLKAMRRECRPRWSHFTGCTASSPRWSKAWATNSPRSLSTTAPRIHGESKYDFGSRVFKATEDMFAVRWLLSRQLKYEVKEETAP